MKKKFFAVALAVAALLAISAGAFAADVKARDFKLQDLQGKTVALSSFKGKIVVLNFWASWCPPCRGELPEFNEMDQAFKKSGEAVLLAVNMTDGQRETKSRVQKFINDQKYGIRVLLDEKGEAANAYGIQYLPTTYVIDAKGVVRGQLVGGTTKDAVIKLVNEAKK